MSIILLSINGIGLGHVARMTKIADQLHASGGKPILLYQNKEYPFSNKLFHKVKIRHLSRAGATYLRAVESQVNAACNICEPRIFIEDTHPANISLRSNIARFLLIRPTTFDYLQKIINLYWDQYDAFFIADHVSSPTWPYNDAETAMISSWQKCHQVGPVFRRSSAEEIAAIKIKYSWRENVPLYVFSMGGGGQQAGGNDAAMFLKEARHLIQQLGNSGRFLFVKGPLFPEGITFPPQMEVIEVEENMPALFAIARAAVIRPGFNSVWECIQAQTPFYYIEGTTFSEPIGQKMKKLAALGLASNKNVFDDPYREQYAGRCRQLLQQWDGTPAQLFYSVMQEAHAVKQRTANNLITSEENTESAVNELQRTAAACASKKLFLRIDDVVSMTDELRFILDLAKELEIFSSLEVIPYLSTLKEEELFSYDNVVVSQHGYGHVLNIENPPGIRSEFSFCDQPPAEEVQNLLAGKQYLEKQFPNRFRHGFSAPFDCFPPWLPAMLKTNSWQYLLENQPGIAGDIRTFKTSIDIWDWNQYKIKPLDVLFRGCIQACVQHGYCALTLHPILLKHASQKKRLRVLLTELKAAGFESYNLAQAIER